MSRLSIALNLLLVFSLCSAQLCFFPDGTPAAGDIPCDPSATYSVCCGPGYACLNNTLCALTANTNDANNDENQYIRGSCTAEDWSESSLCPYYCTGLSNYTGNPAGGYAVQPCSTPNQWVCYGDSCQVDSFLLGSVDGTFAPYTTVTSTPLFSTTSTSSSTVRSQSPTITGSTIAGSAVTGSATTDSSVPSSSASGASIGAAAGQTSAAASASSSSSGLSSGGKIGLGVGITFGLILIGLLGFLIFILMRRSKAKKGDQSHHDQPQGSYSDYPMGSVNGQQDKFSVSDYQQQQQYPHQYPQEQHWNPNSATPVELGAAESRRELDSTPSNRSQIGSGGKSPLNSGTMSSGYGGSNTRYS